MRRRLLRGGGVWVLGVVVVSQASPSAQDVQRTYETQARTFDQFMTLVDSVPRIDPSDEAAVDRLASAVAQVRPQTLAEAYVASAVLVGAANAQLERGIRSEMQKSGVVSFATRLLTDSRYADNIPGAGAARGDIQLFTSRVVARIAAAADHLTPAGTSGPAELDTAELSTNALALEVLMETLRALANELKADRKAMEATQNEKLENAILKKESAQRQMNEQLMRRMMDCMGPAKARVEACTQEVDDDRNAVTAINAEAKTTCVGAFFEEVAVCMATP